MDNLSFPSIRLYALLSHFIMTCSLLWTRFDSIQVTLHSGYTKSDYKEKEDIYVGLVAFGLALLSAQLFMFATSYYQVNIEATLHLVLDVTACFFIAWIVMDGLDWRTYIYILCFCVILPTFGDALRFSLFIQKNFWVGWKSSTSIYATAKRFYENATAWLSRQLSN